MKKNMADVFELIKSEIGEDDFNATIKECLKEALTGYFFKTEFKNVVRGIAADYIENNLQTELEVKTKELISGLYRWDVFDEKDSDGKTIISKAVDSQSKHLKEKVRVIIDSISANDSDLLKDNIKEIVGDIVKDKFTVNIDCK